MDWDAVEAIIRRSGEPDYRAVQVRRAVFEGSIRDYQDISTLPSALRSLLARTVPLMSLSLQDMSVSKDRRCRKAALRCSSDGKVVETVLLRPSDKRWTACISCQVGCAVGCPFCATGLMGLRRNLAPEEITDQVLFWRQFMRKEKLEGRLSHVVYMGMGEPFASYETLSKSLKILMDQKMFNLASRHISVSSSGIAPKIVRFAEDFPQVNFALSLHAASDRLRDRLVPVNKAYPLAELKKALKAYLAKSRRKIFLEYVLLKGENDGPSDAERVVDFARSVGPLELLHVNLIIYNETDALFQPSSESDARRFQKRIMAAGLCATIRQNLGRDIRGACGQLIQT